MAGAFEQRLAAQLSPAVAEARLESEVRRGRDLVRIRVLVTVAAADLGQAAVIAWDVLRVAIGDDAPSWNLAAASAEIQPAAGSVGAPGDTPRRAPPVRGAVSLPGACQTWAYPLAAWNQHAECT